MAPTEIILSLQNALVKLDNADEVHAALKIAEAIDILEIEFDNDPIFGKTLRHAND